MISEIGSDQENRELYERFLKCLLQVVAGSDPLLALSTTPARGEALQTQIVVQGEMGRIYLAFFGLCQGDETSLFVSLARVFDRVSAQFQVYPEEAPFPLSGRRSEFRASLPDGGEIGITAVFIGQFSDRELTGLRWYMLSDQRITARLILFRYQQSGLIPCLQLATTGDLYQLIYQGRELAGEIRFRSGGIYRRSQHGGEIDCYFSGTIEFALMSLADFLAEAPIAIKLPERIPALSSVTSVTMVEIALESGGVFQIVDTIAAEQETFLPIDRTIDRPVATVARSNL